MRYINERSNRNWEITNRKLQVRTTTKMRTKLQHGSFTFALNIYNNNNNHNNNNIVFVVYVFHSANACVLMENQYINEDFGQKTTLWLLTVITL